jgi:hypothetical protein
MAMALEWVARIVAVGLEMVLPGLAGQWLDQRWGTSYMAFLGFTFGIVVGIWHLIAMTRPPSPPRRSGQDQSPS